MMLYPGNVHTPWRIQSGHAGSRPFLHSIHDLFNLLRFVGKGSPMYGRAPGIAVWLQILEVTGVFELVGTACVLGVVGIVTRSRL